MDIIDIFYTNLNIYYSLLIYDEIPPYDLIKELEINDYPVSLIPNISKLRKFERNTRMFVIKHSDLNELLFLKQNNIYQYNIIFCTNSPSFKKVHEVLSDKKPECIENVIITKIFL